jgi:hypothetical protein
MAAEQAGRRQRRAAGAGPRRGRRHGNTEHLGVVCYLSPIYDRHMRRLAVACGSRFRPAQAADRQGYGGRISATRATAERGVEASREPDVGRPVVFADGGGEGLEERRGCGVPPRSTQ